MPGIVNDENADPRGGFPAIAARILRLGRRAGRNAVGLGREKEFLKWSCHLCLALWNPGGTIAVCRLIGAVKEAEGGRDLETLYRNVQILFFLSRNSRFLLRELGSSSIIHLAFAEKNRERLMGQGMTELLVRTLRRLGGLGDANHGAKPKDAKLRLQVALATLAALKQVPFILTWSFNRLMK